MTREYSYFKADGLSLSAIESAEESRLEWAALRKKLQERFGACAIFTHTDEGTGNLRFSCFAFERDAKTPEGWDVDPADDQPGSLASGLPKPGSADDFYLAGMAGLLDRAAKKMQIENQLETGDMPRRSLPAGEYSGAFVRERSFKTPDAKPEGRLRDRYTMCFGSNGGMTMGDPVEYMKMDGDWYIRVPNKPGTETPQFLPADAQPVTYERMLELDRKEYEIRYGRPPAPPNFRPGSGAFC